MSFVKTLVDNSMDIWEEYLKHPFIIELKQGTLDIEKFKHYIVQDSIYLKEYARVYALGMYKSKTLKEIQNFYSILSFVNADETSTRLKYLKEWNITQEDIEIAEVKKENKEYIDFMMKIAEECEVPEILMATLPCMFSYCYIGKEIIKNTPHIESTKYWDFIQDYASDSYVQSCIEWGTYAEELCKDFDKDRKSKLIKIFRQASICEMNFWDMSYNL
ncbi:TenA family transcriptional regulator [Clostridium botulinum]|uniref:Aminopyrimidine aminohydrolase n=2 Tax=Clostridium botulinum TaxID=1491 RepID=A0A6M0X2D1_CLOBO|nr:TenA family protein [Clostridium botulinum]MBN1073943.1 TenA family transcriptional regulator [Clostridium botulinum]NFE58578.1 TenA family transcriptional regulator [Clostridium botulinum]NFF89507.1 TenA family transcriptional regulator [Clostridium botulinum]NFG11156.1 TenA family transcriptional regulator [Clostridium botulinum]NFG25016.1 TenA family transcriptional regulator [Clostridium botulinum]